MGKVYHIDLKDSDEYPKEIKESNILFCSEQKTDDGSAIVLSIWYVLGGK